MAKPSPSRRGGSSRAQWTADLFKQRFHLAYDVRPRVLVSSFAMLFDAMASRETATALPPATGARMRDPVRAAPLGSSSKR